MSCQKNDQLFDLKDAQAMKTESYWISKKFFVTQEMAKLVATNFIKQEMYFKKNAVLKDSQTKFLDYNKYQITPTSLSNFSADNQNQPYNSEQPVINQVIHYDDELGQPSFYTINFSAPKCFVFVSATKKDQPILSFVEGANFMLDSANPYFLNWLNTRAAKIKAYNYNEIGYDTTMTSWASLGIYDSFSSSNPDLLKNKAIGETVRSAPPSGDDPVSICSDIYTYVYTPQVSITNTVEQIGPVTETQWNQFDPYNFYAPIAAFCNGNKAPVGCVAVAIGQIVRYLKRYDNSIYRYYDGISYDFGDINYSTMPNGQLVTGTISSSYKNTDIYPGKTLIYTAGYSENGRMIEKFLRVAGIRASAVYSCQSTAALGYVACFNSLLNTTVDVRVYNQTDVINSLRGVNHNPVFMIGYKEAFVFFGSVPDLTAGHAWVCEGLRTEVKTVTYQKLTYRKTPLSRYLYSAYSSCSYLLPQLISTEYISLTQTINNFYMNWGWGGNNDAWVVGDDARGYNTWRANIVF